MDVKRGVNREETKNITLKKGDSKEKPAQLKKNDNHARQDVKFQEGATEEKSDKFHPFKVKEAISGVDKSNMEDLQMKDATVLKRFCPFMPKNSKVG